MKSLSWITIVLLLIARIAVGDALSQLPPAWSQRLLPLPEQDLSALDAGVQVRIAKVRDSLDRLLTRPRAGPHEIAEAWGKLGALLHVYQMQTAARIALENAHRLAPDEFRWLYYSAWVELGLGEDARALNLLERAARLRPDYAPLILRRADALRALGRLDEAGSLYLRAMKLPGLKAAASAGLAQIALLRRDFERAARLFHEALKLDPKADGLHYPLAQALLRLGRRDEARALLAAPGEKMPRVADELIERLDALHHDARNDYHQAMAALRKRDYARARTLFEQGLKKDRDNPRAEISLARTRYLAGDQDGARAALADIVARHPEQPLAWFLLGVLADAGGDAEAAMDHYRRVLRLDPDHEGANLFLARALYRKGDYHGAARYFDHLIEQGSEMSMAWWFDILAHIGAGEPEARVIERLQAAHEKFPEQSLFAGLLIDRLLAAGDPASRSRALELAEAMARARPIPPLHALLARVLAANGRFDDAIAYQRAVLDYERKQAPDSKALRPFEQALQDYREHRAPKVPPIDPARYQVPAVDAGMVMRNYKAARPY